MRVLVTGSAGKVGRAAVTALTAAGHRVVPTDLGVPRYGVTGMAPYVRADLADYGQAAGVVQAARPDVIVHAAAIPEGAHDPASVVFGNNTAATFNVVEAAARSGVRRVIYISSETVPGFVSAERPWLPHYLPVDESHPVLPQDAYGLSKAVGESIVAALVRRTDSTAVSIRPTLVLTAAECREYQPLVAADLQNGSFNQWAYVDTEDLGDLIALAAAADTPGHEVVYAAQPDNLTGRPLADIVRDFYGDAAPPLRDLPRPDASAISSAKATALFGWEPKRSWRDHVG
jgi:UDP-glucose 4-epimerase